MKRLALICLFAISLSGCATVKKWTEDPQTVQRIESSIQLAQKLVALAPGTAAMLEHLGVIPQGTAALVSAICEDAAVALHAAELALAANDLPTSEAEVSRAQALLNSAPMPLIEEQLRAMRPPTS